MAFRKSVGSDLPKTKRLVQTAEAIPAEIDGDVSIPDGAQPRVDLVGNGRFERARDLVTSEFQPRNRVVMTDAANAKPELVERGFRLLDHPQLLVGHFAEIRDPRRQTGRRRLVP